VNGALSLEQAPPISVPLRFFLTLPAFGALAAFILLWAGADALASRWHPATLAISHLVMLGMFCMVMFGAMFQMLPVLAGVRAPWPRLTGGSCHVLLTGGTLLLAIAFLSGATALFVVAAAMLGLAVAVFAGVIGNGLLRAPQPAASVRGMRWALLGLVVTAIAGITLALGYGLLGMTLLRHPLTDLHLAWGLVGWVAALIVVVAFQVVPMFQMTEPYPHRLRRWLAPSLFVLLTWLSLAVSGLVPGSAAATLALATLLAAFALQTLLLLARRRRKVRDTSLYFWRFGMLSLSLSTLLFGLLQLFPARPDSRLPLALAVLFVAGFGLSIVFAMLYKIVPFLVWLHLQQRLAARSVAVRGYRAPAMRAVLSDAPVRRHLALHLAAVALLLGSLWLPLLVRISAALWLAGLVLLAGNLAGAMRCYIKQSRRIDQLGDGPVCD